MDNQKNAFLNKLKCVINQHKEQVAWMRCVSKLAYVLTRIFLTRICLSPGIILQIWVSHSL